MKSIKNFENYTISKDGVVMNGDFILKQSIDKDGYLCVMLYNNGIRKNMKIHRILYNTFIYPITSDDIVDHIDTNRKNNNLSNLRVISKRENCVNRKNRKEYYAVDIDTCYVYLFDNPNLFQEQFCFTNGKIRTLNNQICLNFIIGNHDYFIFEDELNYVNKLDYNDSIDFIGKLEINYDNLQIKKNMIKKCEYDDGVIEYFRDITEFCNRNKCFVARNVREAVSNNGVYKKCKFSKVSLFDIDSLMKSQRLSKAIDC